jgi:1,4-alpha-glucan branching enzyme
MAPEVPVKLFSLNAKKKSGSYQDCFQKERKNPQLSNSATNTSATHTELSPFKKQKILCNNHSQVNKTLENTDSCSEDSGEEDGDWNNAISVDRETLNNKEKFFLLLDSLTTK